MVKFIIVLKKAIILKGNVVTGIGTFDSIQDALLWGNKNLPDSVEGTIESIQNPKELES